MDFTEKLCIAKNKLLKLDVSSKIGKPHFIHKFLRNLCSSFDIFCAIFNQTPSVLRIKATDGTICTLAVTFNKIVMTAEKEKQQLKQQDIEATKPILISSSHLLTGNQITITVPYCTHCKKNYYSIDHCWVLRLIKNKNSATRA